MTASPEASAKLAPQYVFNIQYSVQFKRNSTGTRILINFSNKINTITVAHIVKVDLTIPKINVEARIITGLVLETYIMDLANFLHEVELKNF